MQVLKAHGIYDMLPDSTREIYHLVLFPFDCYDIDSVNKIILNTYVCSRVFPSTVVEIIGHNDIVGKYDHNMKLSQKRAKTICDYINEKINRKYTSMAFRGIGEEDPLYTNELPEGRFYNRNCAYYYQDFIN